MLWGAQHFNSLIIKKCGEITPFRIHAVHCDIHGKLFFISINFSAEGVAKNQCTFYLFQNRVLFSKIDWIWRISLLSNGGKCSRAPRLLLCEVWWQKYLFESRQTVLDSNDLCNPSLTLLLLIYFYLSFAQEKSRQQKMKIDKYTQRYSVPLERAWLIQKIWIFAFFASLSTD